MVEADDLCDRVAIINRGQVLACDTPAALKKHLQHEAIFTLRISPIQDAHLRMLEKISSVRRLTVQSGEDVSTLEFALQDEETLAAVIGCLTESGIQLQNQEKRESSLEDVFVHLVGHSMEEVERGKEH